MTTTAAAAGGKAGASAGGAAARPGGADGNRGGRRSPRRRGPRSALPGFGLTFGYTVSYLGLIVLLPLAATVGRASTLSAPQFWRLVTSPRALSSYQLSFGASLAAATVNAAGGLLVAWVLTRYRFRGRPLLDAMVDLPFALPTAVAGLALSAVYAPSGWFGRWLTPLGITVAGTPLGIGVALTFVGLPFVVRTVQPVLAELPPEWEEAARALGASRWQTFCRVLWPEILPALLTGFTLAFARAVGEYGSVIFISSNLPRRTEITPLLISAQLDMHDYPAATALAVVMLATSFVLLLLVNLLQRWVGRAVAL